MNNKETRAQLISPTIELELLLDKVKDEKEKDYHLTKKEKDYLENAVENAKKAMGKSLQNIYTVRFKEKKLEQCCDEVIPALDELEKSCETAQRKTKYYKAHQKLLASINSEFTSQLEISIKTLLENMEILYSFPKTDGAVYNIILKKNGIKFDELLTELVSEFYPNCSKEEYRNVVSNILYGKVKNPEPDLWNNMLKCLLKLSDTDEKDPLAYLQSQFNQYIEETMSRLKEIEIPILKEKATGQDQ